MLTRPDLCLDDLKIVVPFHGRSSTFPARHCSPFSLIFNRYLKFFPGVKRTEHDSNQSTPYSLRDKNNLVTLPLYYMTTMCTDTQLYVYFTYNFVSVG
jgi:hypothetical protein